MRLLHLPLLLPTIVMSCRFTDEGKIRAQESAAPRPLMTTSSQWLLFPDMLKRLWQWTSGNSRESTPRSSRVCSLHYTPIPPPLPRIYSVGSCSWDARKGFVQ